MHGQKNIKPLFQCNVLPCIGDNHLPYRDFLSAGYVVGH